MSQRVKVALMRLNLHPVFRGRENVIDEDSESWEGKPLWRHDRDAKSASAANQSLP